MDKNKRILTYVIVFIVLAIGVTFAYFVAQTGDGAKSNVNIKADSVDDLKFSVNKDLSLSANQFNFAQGSGNLSDSVTATASLKANSTKKTATYNYYVYFQMESNEYKYTTVNKLPEIVLSITGPNGEITNVDGLTYVSASDADGNIIKGFDITELGSSIIKIADSFEISSSSSTNYTNQEWVFKVTFINLNTDQTGNQGKTMSGKVLMQKDKLITNVSEVASSGDNLATTLETFSTKSVPSISNLYHHDGTIKDADGNVIDAADGSYRFAGANPNNYVCFGSDDATCPNENLYRIIGLIDGKIKLISADGGTIDMLGTDGGYLASYKSVYSNLSKYKGAGDLSKIGAYYWNTTGKNIWSTSSTNTVNLNTNFLTYLDNINSKWKEMIVDTTWYVGGMTYANGVESNARTAYNYEAGANKDISKTVTAKIGLMYVSDYYYAASKDYWTLPGYKNDTSNTDNCHGCTTDYRATINYNYLYIGLYEYTLSYNSDSSDRVLYVGDVGAAGWSLADSSGYVLRPSFGLTSSVQYNSGSGTMSDPIRLKN